MARNGLHRVLTRLAVMAGVWALVIGMTTSAATARPEPVPVPGAGGDRSGVSRYFTGPQGFAVPTEPCDPAGPSATDGIMAGQLNPQLRAKMAGYLNAYKVSCARMVTQAVKDRGLNPRAAAIAIATIIVESSMNNYSQAVDYTSLGLFQQQDWWGTREERLNPAHATNAFLDAMEQQYPGGSWNNEAIGEVCWHVQRPREDLRGLYAIEADDATLIANALWSGTSAGPKHPYASGRVVSGRSADGRLEAFAAGADGVYHSWQTSVNGAWSQWRFEGGPRNAQLAVAANADGRLELFALSDSTFDHMWQTAPSAGWSGWANFGTGGYRLAAGNNADGRIEVFASNADGVFHRWQTGPTSWSEWTGTGGISNAELTTSRSVDGRVEVFAINADTASHAWQTGPNASFSQWETFGGGGTEIGASNNADGRIEVFGTSRDGVYHRWQTGFTTWSEWGWLNDSGPAMN
ncbi:peptidase M23 [Streptomyces sp. NBC_00090]|uniref:peptidase M23 n=1 Tax=Streptomyces sp. NBC_00090 TaxID=2903619 RepID=UPI003254C752